MIEADLVGVWRLVSYHDVDGAGRRSRGPLGDDPCGTLIYTADGHVSVHMMRTSGAAVAPGSHDYMGYAGTWRISGGDVVHTVRISPTRRLVGTEQVREAEFSPGRLVLHGVARIGDVAQRRVLTWVRR